MDEFDSIAKHAEEVFPQEACGLLLTTPHGFCQAKPCRNVSENPESHFDIDPSEIVKHEDSIVAYYHSHPDFSAQFSEADLSCADAASLPVYVYSVTDKSFNLYRPKSCKERPLLGRQFLFGLSDCVTLVEDYIWQRHGLTLPYIHRNRRSLLEGMHNLYTALPQRGFVSSFGQEKEGDILLYAIGASSVNHAAVVTKDGKIMHQLHGHASTEEPRNGCWATPVMSLRHSFFI